RNEALMRMTSSITATGGRVPPINRSCGKTNSAPRSAGKSLPKGFGFQGSYTWSKNLSNVGFNAANLNDPLDLDQQYGPTPYSRPHRFVVGYQYQLPFKGTGIVGTLVQDWMVSGTTLIQNRRPAHAVRWPRRNNLLRRHAKRWRREGRQP